MEKQCGSCAFARRFFAVDCASNELDRVECTSDAHAAWLDRQNLTAAFSLEMGRQGYMNLLRLERLARRDYECPHWRSREAGSSVHR